MNCHWRLVYCPLSSQIDTWSTKVWNQRWWKVHLALRWSSIRAGTAGFSSKVWRTSRCKFIFLIQSNHCFLLCYMSLTTSYIPQWFLLLAFWSYLLRCCQCLPWITFISPIRDTVLVLLITARVSMPYDMIGLTHILYILTLLSIRTYLAGYHHQLVELAYTGSFVLIKSAPRSVTLIFLLVYSL